MTPQVPPDTHPQEDRERSPVRITLTASILMSVAMAILPAGITWGVYKNRIESLEKATETLMVENKDLRALVYAHDRRIAQLDAQYTAQSGEMIRRLDRIERKIDGRER